MSRARRYAMVSRDQAVGAGLVAVAILVFGAILYLLFFSPWALLTLKIIAIIGVGVIAGLVGWIGYTLATTPPPKPIEEIEKELEEELKKLEQELQQAEIKEEKSGQAESTQK